MEDDDCLLTISWYNIFQIFVHGDFWQSWVSWSSANKEKQQNFVKNINIDLDSKHIKSCNLSQLIISSVQVKYIAM